MKSATDQYDLRYLRLLKMGPFQRRGGAWRFGANRLNDGVVARLIAAGRVIQHGDQIMLARKELP